tara:strand:+ start:199 stop:408 length:210 start_codon:yes stop_codon:yes gene_type:complete
MKLYIVRVGTYGELKDSRPCLNCFNTIKNLGIKKIIYSTNDSSIVSQKVCDYHTESPSLGYKFIANSLK